MPRKKLIYTDAFPYHVMARSNNREWFYIPKETLWQIVTYELNEVVQRYEAMIHAFVLMDNHYHMLISASPGFDLGKIMSEFQKSVSRTVNGSVGRTNHLFGGPYKGCLISNAEYFAKVIHYIYRNPIEAGLVNRIEDYKYSSIDPTCKIITSSRIDGFHRNVPHLNLAEWINTRLEDVDRKLMGTALRKTIFKMPSMRAY